METAVRSDPPHIRLNLLTSLHTRTVSPSAHCVLRMAFSLRIYFQNFRRPDIASFAVYRETLASTVIISLRRRLIHLELGWGPLVSSQQRTVLFWRRKVVCADRAFLQVVRAEVRQRFPFPYVWWSHTFGWKYLSHSHKLLDVWRQRHTISLESIGSSLHSCLYTETSTD